MVAVGILKGFELAKHDCYSDSVWAVFGGLRSIFKASRPVQYLLEDDVESTVVQYLASWHWRLDARTVTTWK